ncbi:MAG TPA: NAD+ synthase [Kosmotogaceae bacterium]|nr:NAD+ synthase [Kosmotogaceae bacterium]
MVLRVGLAQINTTVGDFEGNTRKICNFVSDAEEKETSVLVFPELTLTGYPPEDLLLKTSFVKKNLSALQKIVDFTRGKRVVIVVGFVDFDTEIYNSAAVIRDGEIYTVYRKMVLPNYSVFDERRYFSPGQKSVVLSSGRLRTGINICEDLWLPSGPMHEQAGAGASVILNLSASPFTVGKVETRHALLRTRAMEYSSIVAYCNLVGGQDELVFDGRSCIVTPTGEIFSAPAFEEHLFLMDVDPDVSTRYNLFEGKRKGYTMRSIVSEIPLEMMTRDRAELSGSPHIDSADDEDVFRALVLGLRDYAHKNHFEEAVLGVSGGIDSALCAAIAVEALGRENVVGVVLPSHVSSKESLEDASRLCENLGIRKMQISIKEPYDACLSVLKEHFSKASEDTTEENIQARLRAVIWMALSNKFGWLVLTAGNKSELATGYTTLYGDMAGGLSVLKDVYKTEVYSLSRYYNNTKGRNVIPEEILKKPPSAELKFGQIDQDSLPPYDTLDRILRYYIEEGFSLNEIVEKGFERETVADVLSLVKRSEYKRRQGPPGIKVNRRSFGRDWRMPLTNEYKSE